MFVALDKLDPEDARTAVAVLPLGATETHGPHLPLETDTLIANGILEHAPETKTRIVRLPTISIGASAEHADHAGTESIEPEVLIAQIVNVGEQVSRAGIKRMVLFNAHGGNVAPASIAALKLRTRFGMLAASAHWLDFGLPADLTPPAPAVEDVHGGWIETSVLLHLAPTFVKGLAKPQAATPPAASLFPAGPIAWGWMTSDLAPDGYIGRPDLATAEIGRTLVKHAAHRLVALIQELAAAQWPR
jgi:creatinine amidohydrolase